MPTAPRPNNENKIPSMPDIPNCWCSKGSAAPYWSNPAFLTFEIQVLWCSVLSARAPKSQKLKW